MKKAEAKGNLNNRQPQKDDGKGSLFLLQQQIQRYKKENDILLNLSNAITMVRHKNDLVKVFSSTLKEYFYFTHAVISLINKQKGTYFPFLIDKESMHIKHRKELPSLLKMDFVIEDPFIHKAADSEAPVAFLLEEIINKPGVPAFLKVNYECGIKKAMIVKLKNKNEIIGFVFVYSDETDSFPDEFRNILYGIAPHLSNAVANIIINEEIVEKDKDKSFLVEFSHNIASARTKDELSRAIHETLKTLIQVRAYFIRTINEDGITLSPFMHDDEVHYKDDPEFKNLLATKLKRTEGLTGRVLKGSLPVLIDFAEEVSQGNTDHYIEFWKGLGPQKSAFQKMAGIPLRTGDTDVGVLWIITDKINMDLLEGIGAQISVAISNIRSNENIAQREEEKSILLSLTKEIAALRNRSDLARVVNLQFKTLFSINDFGFLQVNEDHTYSTFMLDLGDYIQQQPEYTDVTSRKYSVNDLVFSQIRNADEPVIFDVNKLAENPEMPGYVFFWKKIGLQRVLGVSLRVGGENIGCAFLHIDANKTGDLKINLLKAVCAQVAVAMSNIISNEEIAQREEEKSILLSLSDEIAALRSRNDLLHVVNTRIKALFSINEFGIAQINEDGTTYSAFMLDVSDHLKSNADFEKVTSAKYNVDDPVFITLMSSEDPVMLDVLSMAKKTGAPAYVGFWKKAGLQRVLGMRMRVGGKNVGCAFLHLDANRSGITKGNLLKAVCAQIAVAMSNIISNEEIAQREKEKSFLLDFSSNIALVRTKEELDHIIRDVLRELNPRGGYVIRRINEDDATLSPYIYDLTREHDPKVFSTLEKSRYPVNDGLQNRVLDCPVPILFNIDSEIRRGISSTYLLYWKQMGIKTIIGVRLRHGVTNLGILFVDIGEIQIELLQGICAQISIAIANIMANDQINAYKKQLEVENEHLKEQIKTIYNFSEIIGNAPAMQKVYHLMSLVAESNSTVLLLGETGTGKELIARALHNSSPRKAKLMIKVNCAALPANLIESELFGHEKGSFTGAIERRIGKFELANNSTLFLDEIGEMPLETQVKLLRVLQERELERVGGKTTIKVDVRIIAATNRNLENEVKAGRFRSDLYYRLNVFPIILPSLRDRKEDIALLADFFLDRYSRNSGKRVTSISMPCIKKLQDYSWPGNVRELEHLIERSILLTQGNVLSEVQLPNSMNENTSDGSNISEKNLQQLEKDYIIEILKRCKGKISGKGGAAAILEIPATTLHSKMKKLDISKADYFSKAD